MITPTPIATSKKVALTIILPAVNFNALVSKTKKLTRTLFSNIYNPLSGNFSRATTETTSRARRLRIPRMLNFKDGFKLNKNGIKMLVPFIVGVVILIVIVSLVRSLPDAKSRPVTDSKQVVTANALATIPLDRKFTFPLKDEKGKEVGNFDYVIQAASLQKQIIVQGQRATAVSGRVFLILNLKITNNLKQTIQLNTKDYLRLVVTSNSTEQLAPDIHNDPVEVQAISTKYTRVGVAVDEVDASRKIVLKVGEINGDKQTIDLNFKY